MFGHTSHTTCFMGCFLAFYAVPCARQSALYCSDLSNLLHLHWLDIFSPFPKLAIKASFAAVLMKLKLPLKLLKAWDLFNLWSSKILLFRT